jgi:hypothetical protein
LKKAILAVALGITTLSAQAWIDLDKIPGIEKRELGYAECTEFNQAAWKAPAGSYALLKKEDAYVFEESWIKNSKGEYITFKCGRSYSTSSHAVYIAPTSVIKAEENRKKQEEKEAIKARELRIKNSGIL